jgi:hypothetical protein
MRRSEVKVSRSAITIGALALTLVVSNVWWAYQSLDAGITRTYAQASQESTTELLAQTLAVLPVVAKAGSSRDQVVAAARLPADRTEPYEKGGFVWVGQLGLKFNAQGQFESAVTSEEAATK